MFNYIRTQPGDTIAHCKECGSGNIVMQQICVGHHPAQYSHWFECRNCKYSTPGRPSRDEACQDVDWIRLDGKDS